MIYPIDYYAKHMQLSKWKGEIIWCKSTPNTLYRFSEILHENTQMEIVDYKDNGKLYLNVLTDSSDLWPTFIIIPDNITNTNKLGVDYIDEYIDAYLGKDITLTGESSFEENIGKCIDTINDICKNSKKLYKFLEGSYFLNVDQFKNTVSTYHTIFQNRFKQSVADIKIIDISEDKTNNMKEYSTGALRENKQGKGRMDLLQWKGLQRVSHICEEGASLHGEHNWCKGLPLSSFMDSAVRHISQYMLGDIDEDHLAKAAWNLLSAIQIEETIPEMNDLHYRKD